MIGRNLNNKIKILHIITAFIIIFSVIGFIQYLLGNLFPDKVNIEMDLLTIEAHALLNGKLPFIDFLSREPFWLWTQAIKLKFLGAEHVHSLRYPLWMITIITSFFVFRLWVSEGLALLGTVLYALNPYGYYNNDDQFYLMFFFLLFSLWYKNKSKRILFYTGLLLGFCINYYRGSFPYMLGLAILIGILNKNRKDLLSDILHYWMGLLITLVLPLMYFIFQTSLAWMENTLMAGKLLAGFIVVPFITYFSFTIKKIWIQSSEFRRYFAFWFLPLTLIFSILLVKLPMPPYEMGEVTGLKNKLAILSAYFTIYPYVLWGLIFSAFTLVKNSSIFKYYKNTSLILLFSYLLIVIICIFVGNQFMPRAEFLKLKGIFFKSYIIILGLTIIFLCTLIFKAFINRKSRLFIIFHLLIFYLPLYLLTLYYPNWLILYMRNHYIFLILVSLNLFYFLSNFFKKAAIFMIFINLIFGLSWNYYEKSKYKYYVFCDKKQVENVIEFLKNYPVRNKKIFTTISPIVLRTNSELVPFITHPLIYVRPEVDNPVNWDPYKIFLTVPEIIQTLDRENVDIIVADYRFKSIFFKRHKEIKKYINAYYKVIKTFKNTKFPRDYNTIVIYQRKNIFNATKEYEKMQFRNLKKKIIFENFVQFLGYKKALKNNGIKIYTYWKPISPYENYKESYVYCHLHLPNNERLDDNEAFFTYTSPYLMNEIYKVPMSINIKDEQYNYFKYNTILFAFGLFLPEKNKKSEENSFHICDFLPLNEKDNTFITVNLPVNENVILIGYKIFSENDKTYLTLKYYSDIETLCSITPILKLNKKKYLILNKKGTMKFHDFYLPKKWQQYLAGTKDIFSIDYLIDDDTPFSDVKEMELTLVENSENKFYRTENIIEENINVNPLQYKKIQFYIPDNYQKFNKIILDFYPDRKVEVFINDKKLNSTEITQVIHKGLNEITIKNQDNELLSASLKIKGYIFNPYDYFKFIRLSFNFSKKDFSTAEKDQDFQDNTYIKNRYIDSHIKILGYKITQNLPKKLLFKIYYNYISPPAKPYEIITGNEKFDLPVVVSKTPFVFKFSTNIKSLENDKNIYLNTQKNKIKLFSLNYNDVKFNIERGIEPIKSIKTLEEFPLKKPNWRNNYKTTFSQEYNFSDIITLSEITLKPCRGYEWKVSFICKTDKTLENVSFNFYTTSPISEKYSLLEKKEEKHYLLKEKIPEDTENSYTEKTYFVEATINLKDCSKGLLKFFLQVQTDKGKLLPPKQFREKEFLCYIGFIYNDYYYCSKDFLFTKFLKDEKGYSFVIYPEKEFFSNNSKLLLCLNSPISNTSYQIDKLFKDSLNIFTFFKNLNFTSPLLRKNVRITILEISEKKSFEEEIGTYNFIWDFNYKIPTNPMFNIIFEKGRYFILFNVFYPQEKWAIVNDNIVFPVVFNRNLYPFKKFETFIISLNDSMASLIFDSYFKIYKNGKLVSTYTFPQVESQITREKVFSYCGYDYKNLQCITIRKEKQLKHKHIFLTLSSGLNIETMPSEDAPYTNASVYVKISKLFKFNSDKARNTVYKIIFTNGDIGYIIKKSPKEYHLFTNRKSAYYGILGLIMGLEETHSCYTYSGKIADIIPVIFSQNTKMMKFRENKTENAKKTRYYFIKPLEKYLLSSCMENASKGISIDTNFEPVINIQQNIKNLGLNMKNWKLETVGKGKVDFDIQGKHCYKLTIEPLPATYDHALNDMIKISKNLNYTITLKTKFSYWIRYTQKSNIKCSLQLTLYNPDTKEEIKTWINSGLVDQNNLSMDWYVDIVPYALNKWLFRTFNLGKYKGWKIKDIHFMINDYPDNSISEKTVIYIDGIYLGEEQTQNLFIKTLVEPVCNFITKDKSTHNLKMLLHYYPCNNFQVEDKSVKTVNTKLKLKIPYWQMWYKDKYLLSFKKQNNIIHINTYMKHISQREKKLISIVVNKHFQEKHIICCDYHIYKIEREKQDFTSYVEFPLYPEKWEIIRLKNNPLVKDLLSKNKYFGAYFDNQEKILYLPCGLKKIESLKPLKIERDKVISKGSAPGIKKWILIKNPSSWKLSHIFPGNFYMLKLIIDKTAQDHFVNDLPTIEDNMNINIKNNTYFSYSIYLDSSKATNMHFSLQLKLYKNKKNIDTAFADIYDQHGNSIKYSADLNAYYTKKWYSRKFYLGNLKDWNIRKIYFMANDEPNLKNQEDDTFTCYISNIIIYDK